MSHWILIVGSIVVLTIYAVIRSHLFGLRVLVVLFGLAGLVGAYIALETGAPPAGQIEAQLPVSTALTDSLDFVQRQWQDSVASQERAIDSLERELRSVRDELALRSKQYHQLKSASQSQASDEEKRPERSLGARLGQSRPVGDNLYERIDQFRAIEDRDLRDVSITIRFNHRFERKVITQRAVSSMPDNRCPAVDTVVSSPYLEYKCDFLAAGTWIEVITYSEFPLEIEEIKLQPE